jgi:hypothetical protein
VRVSIRLLNLISGYRKFPAPMEPEYAGVSKKPLKVSNNNNNNNVILYYYVIE